VQVLEQPVLVQRLVRRPHVCMPKYTQCGVGALAYASGSAVDVAAPMNGTDLRRGLAVEVLFVCLSVCFAKLPPCVPPGPCRIARVCFCATGYQGLAHTRSSP
jgi:hypothetical protein